MEPRYLEQKRGAKKVVSFEIDEATVTTVDGDSSVLSSVTTLSAHGTRDLREVVEEIQDEFMTASNFGKEVALLLEVTEASKASLVYPLSSWYANPLACLTMSAPRLLSLLLSSFLQLGSSTIHLKRHCIVRSGSMKGENVSKVMKLVNEIASISEYRPPMKKQYYNLALR
ncbi:hypothetical protein JHK82_049848 [Glycine max]|nr:hypothetical protein JHK85_050471 [Glycine max]KAG5091070.1 hypothetical protein JHK82_049848 [Glycine max]KAG5094169.1 hypothetical protein JHK84_049757 [Glycine max]